MIDNPTVSPLIQLANTYRRRLSLREQAAMSRAVEAYTGIYSRLKDKIDLLALEIANGQLTAGEVKRMERYLDLIAATQRELTKYGSWTETEIQTLARQALGWGIADSEGLLKAAAGGIKLPFNRLPTEAVETLLGFLSPDGPLFKRLSRMPGFVAQELAQAILEGVGLGYNPKKTARIITDTLGMGLTDSMRMMRTAQLWSYREATRANYAANSDVVQGWIWYAQLDGTTCMSCCAQHGSVHPLNEPLQDHHAGRCTSLPYLIGQSNPITETGQGWFEKLSETEQRDMMGDSKWESWKEGRFDFAALSRPHIDDIYGEMLTESSLRDLLGKR